MILENSFIPQRDPTASSPSSGSRRRPPSRSGGSQLDEQTATSAVTAWLGYTTNITVDTAMYDPTDRVALGTFKVCADEYGCRGGTAILATRRPNLGRLVFGWFVGHRNPMRTYCQFTVKRSEV